MRTRGDLGEPHIVAFDEQLHAENAATAECVGDLLGVIARIGQRGVGHRLWLPRLAVIAIHLHVADGIAKAGAVHMPHGELRDLVIEINKALHDHLAGARAAAFLRVLPRGLNVRLGLERALPLAATGHDGLHHARQPNALDGPEKFLLRCRKLKRRRAQAQLLRGQAPNAFTIHRELRRARGGDNLHLPLCLDGRQRVRGNRFHLRHDEMRLLLFNHRPQRLAIKHRNHMRPIGHLHRRRIGVRVYRNHFHTVALQLDNNFLAQLARPAQQNSPCPVRKWCPDGGAH